MDDKTGNAERVKRQSEIAFENVRALEGAAFTFWAYAREHELTSPELVRLMGVIVDLITPVVNSVGECKEAAEEAFANG